MTEASAITAVPRHARRSLVELTIAATAASSRSGDADAHRQLAALVRRAPVEHLPAAARLHRVAGSVLRGLDGLDGVPAEVRDALSASRQAAALRHLATIGVLAQVGAALDGAGVAWVVMKGPFLAGKLYPDPGDRAYGDLDVLVAPAHYGTAMEVLESLGFRHNIHNWALAEQMLAGAVSMASPLVELDLHWHLHYSREDRMPFALDPDAMLDRSRRVTFSGVTAPTLDPVDTLLNLAFHAARSGGHRLLWLKDIERSITADEPDLDELVRRSRAARCAPQVGLMLDRCSAVLGVPVPDGVVHALTPAGLRVADTLVRKVSSPVQLHERETLMRWMTRSVRATLVRSVAAAPERGIRAARRKLFPPPVNETDDAEEKARYVRAVAAAGRARD